MQESTVTPKIYAEKGNNKIDITTTCSKIQDETTQIYSLNCSPTGLEEDSTYTITYEGACANTGSTEIEITIEKAPVPVDNFVSYFLRRRRCNFNKTNHRSSNGNQPST